MSAAADPPSVTPPAEVEIQSFQRGQTIIIGARGAAEYAGVNLRHLRYQLGRGRLHPSRVGGRLVFTTTDLDAWKREHRAVPVLTGTWRCLPKSPTRPFGLDELGTLARAGIDLDAVAAAIGARPDRARRWLRAGVPNRWLGAVRRLAATLPTDTGQQT